MSDSRIPTDKESQNEPEATSQQKTLSGTLTGSIVRNSLTLGLFAILTVGLIALTFVLTEKKIHAQVRAFEARALKEILPDKTHDNNILDARITIPANDLLATSTEKYGYVAFKNDKPVAVILPAIAPDGYAGKIDLLVGIYADGTLAGVRATQHKETPGLGDKIDTKVSDWILQFQGKSLLDPAPEDWGVKKDGGQFDQFTGATITPRAVVGSVYRTLNYFDAHREALFKEGEAAMNGETALSRETDLKGETVLRKERGAKK
ncbi:electron transport complex subunit RsxG [Endozoicomonas sp. 8E]|uniref:electron transport complex subunit RsxG n=1 Tax=Endozoicomonas sp. 8E TaxID=3035692 RepID=UPI002938E852|nr:electron transport complex subunit RsxG [Endozoicomonas sp. 8E]WOG26598.1 electron transport complex subunit RsxG [Endozoicomonas sp. 8E]